MTTSFTVGTRTVFPLLVDEFETARQVNNVFNPVIGGGAVAVAFKPSLRTGSMSAVFTTIGAALDFDNMLAGVDPITWSDSDLPELSLTFLPDQEIRINQSDEMIVLPWGEEGYLWSVSFGYQEVST